MVFFYVYGAGLGHLHRILRYIDVNNISVDTCVLLTNSIYTHRIPKEITVLYHEDAFFRDIEPFFKQLQEYFALYRVIELVVDVFPSGFYGELAPLDSISITKNILARILSPSYFEKHPNSPNYNKLIQLEKGIDVANYRYNQIEKIELNHKIVYIKNTINHIAPFFLIIHSGPAEEVMQLYKLAKLYQKSEEHIYIQTMTDDMNIEYSDSTLILSEKPNFSMLENASKIFTACGFNTFFETIAYRNKQHFLPFKRRYDDQFKRKRINPY